jgi:Bacteriophage head to tail connecting protein
MAANVASLVKRLQRLETLRQPHETVWRDCFDHSFPIRGSGLQGGAPLDAQQAMDRKARLLHSAGTDSARTLAAAIVSGATPSSSVWALLDVGGSDAQGKLWLDAKGKQLHEEVHAGTFDAAAYECALDLVAAGWFALYVDVDREIGGLTFTQWSIASVYAATTKAGGPVDTVFRKYTLTSEQCVTEFGMEGVSQQTRKKYEQTPDDLVTLCHAIYPRTAYSVGARMAKNLPIASCHFELDSHHLLRESGYHEMPVIVPRWAVIPDTCYAIGPMFDALPDCRELNTFLGMDKSNAELAIAGMWIAEDDGVLNPRTVKVGARKVIVANSVDSMKQLSAGGDWQLADTRIAQYIGSIRKIMMADQLQPQDGPAMTATEVHVRVGMIRQLLGPIYGRLQAEYLAPLVERCFGLMYRAGQFGEAPDSLGGQSLRVRYNNPLARAQKMEDVNAIERLNQNLLGLANLGAIAPAAAGALDVIDFDANVRTLVDGLGVPLKNVRDPDQLQAFRDERAKQQAQAQQQEQAQQMQATAADAMAQRSIKAA